MSRLHLASLTKHFARGPQPAVEDVSFTVEAGTFAALVGESGAGKSTLLRLIAGLEQPDTGEIHLGERPLSSARRLVPPERRGIGFVFQNHALFPHLNVFENITFGLRGRPRAERVAEAERWLALVRLSGRERRMPHELSGGERQRIALARTLAPRPALVLLDEPFSSLDATLRGQVRDDVQAILRQAGVTTLLVTHDVSDALALADRIAVIKAGRIQQIDTPAVLYRRPANRYVAAFFGACNFLPPAAFARFGSAPGLYRPEPDGEAWIRPADLHIVSAEEARLRGGQIGHLTGSRFYGGHWEIRFQPTDPAWPAILVHAPEEVRGSARAGLVGLLPRMAPTAAPPAATL